MSEEVVERLSFTRYDNRSITPSSIIENSLIFSTDEVQEIIEADAKRRAEQAKSDKTVNTRVKGQLRIQMTNDNEGLMRSKSFVIELNKNPKDSNILFSGKAKKIAKKERAFDRIVVVTRELLFLVEPITQEVKRRFSLASIDSILKPAYGEEPNHVALIMPGEAHDYLLTVDKREMFIDHLRDAYEALTDIELPLFYVDGIRMFVRRTKGERVPPPVNITEKEVIRGSEKDLAGIAKSSKWRFQLRKYGDKIVHFSESDKQKNEKVLFVTDQALYTASESAVLRRIDLKDIREILISIEDPSEFLVKVPSEYDLILKSQSRTELVELFQKLLTDPIITQSSDLTSVGQLKPTVEYKRRIAQTRDPENVRIIMKEAVISKDLTQIEKAMDIARKIDLEDDKLFQLCSLESKKIKLAAEAKEQIQKAYADGDMKLLRDLLDRCERFKPHLTDTIRQMTQKYIGLVNRSIINKKMQEAIQSRSNDKIKPIFSFAIQVGMNEEVSKQKLDYDLVIQRESTKSLLQDCIDKHDAEGVRLLLLSAKSLGIENEKCFADARVALPKLKEEQKAIKLLSRAIDDANEVGNPEIITEEIEKRSKKFPWLTEAGFIKRAKQEIELIPARKDVKKKIRQCVVAKTKDKDVLRSIIELNEGDKYIDLTEIKKMYQEILNVEAQERLKLINMEDERMNLALDEFESAPTPKNEEKLLKIIEEVKDYPELEGLVACGKELIQQNREEKVQEKELLNSVKKGLHEAISNSNTSIDIIKRSIGKAKQFSTVLQDDIKKAEELVVALEKDAELDRVLKAKQQEEEEIQLSEVIKEAQQVLNSLDELEIQKQFEEIMQVKDTRKLIGFIKQHKNMISEEDYQKALELIATQEVKSKLLSANPLINNLHSNLMTLLSSCTLDDLDSQGKYVINSDNPFGQNVVRSITAILSHDTARRFWISSRTPWDIFKGLQVSAMQNIVREFEAFDVMQQLPSDSLGVNASLLFVQYLLDRGMFMYALSKLLLQELYLSDCYEKSSVMLSVKYRDEMLGVFSLLEQFQFKFGFDKYSGMNFQMSAEMIAAHPILQVKSAVKSIVSYFYLRAKQHQELDILDVGDETKNAEIGLLVRKKLCFTLVDILASGFRSRLFGSNHIWKLILDAGELKKTSAVDIGGIGLPTAIQIVNNVVAESTRKGDLADDVKFRIFVCYALNDSQLSEFMQSIFREQQLVQKYYDTTAILYNIGMQKKLVNLLAKLDKLPFKLNLNAEVI